MLSQIFLSILFIGITFFTEGLQQYFVCTGNNDIYQSHHEHPVICKQRSLCLFFTKNSLKLPDKSGLKTHLVTMNLSSFYQVCYFSEPCKPLKSILDESVWGHPGLHCREESSPSLAAHYLGRDTCTRCLETSQAVYTTPFPVYIYYICIFFSHAPGQHIFCKTSADWEHPLDTYTGSKYLMLSSV